MRQPPSSVALDSPSRLLLFRPIGRSMGSCWSDLDDSAGPASQGTNDSLAIICSYLQSFLNNRSCGIFTAGDLVICVLECIWQRCRPLPLQLVLPMSGVKGTLIKHGVCSREHSMKLPSIARGHESREGKGKNFSSQSLEFTPQSLL